MVRAGGRLAPRDHGRAPIDRQRRASRPARRPRPRDPAPALRRQRCPAAPRRPAGALAEWAAAFRTTGQELRRAVQAGTLDRGLRHMLSYHVIFHWNRLGLSMRGQSILAWAARAAILHGESGA
ncbi:thiopeptide-type bacteriocin biosynthesis protein [Streptomyces umbrinus]|uniref:thiopeptide-type bacteriocin biosynthesis protein n=1 Tax=Streptomyces umbrinus TaxID=67370 RepID=UPI0027D91062|nr:thiopeptide-type bacteriocin biosynthesis protein [Streptomyces umbrinus]